MELIELNPNAEQVAEAEEILTPLAADSPLAGALRERGHEVVVEPTVSGAGFLKRVPGGWIGAADPRRDGVALGR